MDFTKLFLILEDFKNNLGDKMISEYSRATNSNTISGLHNKAQFTIYKNPPKSEILVKLNGKATIII